MSNTPSAKQLLSLIWQYLWNILIAIDQLGNVVLLFGDPDETMSSNCAKTLRRAAAKSVEAPLLFRKLAWFLEWVDPGHLKRSIEDDEGMQAVYRWKP